MSDRTLFDAAQRAAARAAAHTLTGFRTHPVFERKGRSDLVTRFDRESESILREELEKTGVAVVGEETMSHELGTSAVVRAGHIADAAIVVEPSSEPVPLTVSPCA